MFDVTSDGLILLFSIPIRGSIAYAQLFRIQDSTADSIIVQTDKYNVLVIEYDHTEKRPICRLSGDIRDKVGRPAECGLKAAVDPTNSVMAVHAYTSMMKFIRLPTSTQRVLESFNVRLFDDMTFLHDICYLPPSQATDVPTLVVLYEDASHAKFITTLAISFSERKAVNGPISQPIPVESIVSRVYPVADGFLRIGEQFVTFANPRTAVEEGTSFPHAPLMVNSLATVDSNRILVGDHTGRVHLVSVTGEGSSYEVRVELLGTGAIPHAMQYIDNSVFFTASFYGDSQLVRINPEPDASGSCLTVLETFPNTAPISDAIHTATDQGGLVTCSGGFQDGTLRTLSKGVGASMLAQLPCRPPSGMWTLETDVTQPSIVVMSFSQSTMALTLGETIARVDPPHLITDERTLLAAGTPEAPVQITPTRVISGASVWSPPEDGRIAIAATDAGRGVLGLIAVATSAAVYVLDTTLSLVMTRLTETPPSALAIASFMPQPVLALATWYRSEIQIINISGQTEDQTIDPDCGLVKSLALVRFDPPKGHGSDSTADYLLASMLDGSLAQYIRADAAFVQTDAGPLALGNRHFPLIPCHTVFQAQGAVTLTAPHRSSFMLALAPSPTLIYGTARRLLHSAAKLPVENVPHCATMAHITTAAGTHDVLLTGGQGGVTVCALDPVQRMQITTNHLGELPRRIVRHKDTKAIVVGTVAVVAKEGIESEASSLIVLHGTTMAEVGRLTYDDHEMVSAIISTSLGRTGPEYVVVGTTLAYAEEVDARRGRVYVYSMTETGLTQVGMWQVNGLAVYDLCSFFDGRVVVALDSKVLLLKWDAVQASLTADIGYYGMILCVKVRSLGHRILIGDVLKSVTLLQLNAAGTALEEVAMDYNPVWTTAIHMISDDTFLVADSFRNVFVVTKTPDGGGEKRTLLENVASYHLGQQINSFTPGALSALGVEASSDRGIVPEVVFSTSAGSVGVINRITPKMYSALHNLELTIAELTAGVNITISHQFFRAYFSDKTPEIEPRGFIDGDVVEELLSFPRNVQADIVAKADVDMELDQVLGLLEELSQTH